MNEFEKSVAVYIGKEGLRKIQKVKVGIAGAGGLGSNCAVNLVRSGFKRFRIVDFDVVEGTNLNRQFYFLGQIGMPKVEALRENLLKINPGLELEMIQEKVARHNVEQMFNDCHVVIEAFDKAEFKALLVENYSVPGKLLVSASGLGGWGKSDDITVRKVREGFYLVGDLVSEVNESRPPVSPRVNIAAAKQADIVLEYVLNGGI